MKLTLRPYKIKRGPLKGFYTMAWQPQRHWFIRFLLWLISPITYFVNKYRYRKALRGFKRLYQEIKASQIHTLQQGLKFLKALEPYVYEEED